VSKKARKEEPAAEKGEEDEVWLEPNALWHINCDQFHRDLRHEQCTNLVFDLLGEKATVVLQATLDIAAPGEVLRSNDLTPSA